MNDSYDGFSSKPGIRVAVTGADGFLGSKVISELTRRGVAVRALVHHLEPRPTRSPMPSPGIEMERVAYSLREPLGADTLDGCAAVIHLAWATRDRSAEAQNDSVTGTLALAEAARRAGARFVFVSSISARSEVTSNYGMAKLRAESALSPEVRIVRLGLVVGDDAGGLYGRIRTVSRLPVLAVPGPDTLEITTTDCPAAVHALVEAAVGDDTPSEHRVTIMTTITMRELVAQAAAPRTPPRIIPVSAAATTRALDLLGRLGGPGAELADGLRAITATPSTEPSKEPTPDVRSDGSAHVRRLDADQVNSEARLTQHRSVLENKPEVVEVFRELHHEMLELERTCSRCSGGGRLELGAGVFPLAMTDPTVLSSEVVPSGHVDLLVDAQNMPFATNSMATLFLQNVFHHFPDPARFLEEAARVLKPGGLVILLEPYHGLFASLLYPHLFSTETFDKHAVGWRTDVEGPMLGANQALSSIVFERDRALFEHAFPSLSIVASTTATNWIRYLVSGGLNFPRLLPRRTFPALAWIEAKIRFANPVLALHHFVVLRVEQTKP